MPNEFVQQPSDRAKTEGRELKSKDSQPARLQLFLRSSRFRTINGPCFPTSSGIHRERGSPWCNCEVAKTNPKTSATSYDAKPKYATVRANGQLSAHSKR